MTNSSLQLVDTPGGARSLSGKISVGASIFALLSATFTLFVGDASQYDIVAKTVVVLVLAYLIGNALWGWCVTPLANRLLLGHSIRKLLEHEDTAISDNHIVFHRARPKFWRLVARVAGHDYKDCGYVVTMRCPEDLWLHGGIGQMFCGRDARIEHGSEPFLTDGIEGLVKFRAPLVVDIRTNERYMVMTGIFMQRLMHDIKGFHDQQQELRLRDVQVESMFNVDHAPFESARDKAARFTYQLDTMIAATNFLDGVRQRLLNTDLDKMPITDLLTTPSRYDIGVIGNIPLLIKGDDRFVINPVNDEQASIPFGAGMIVGWVAAKKGLLVDDPLGRGIVEAYQDVVQHEPQLKPGSQELANRVLQQHNQRTKDPKTSDGRRKGKSRLRNQSGASLRGDGQHSQRQYWREPARSDRNARRKAEREARRERRGGHDRWQV